ncbi:MAG: hypothetical protein MK101_04270 [Phycisphaerales bacterium]|nr:hypothetical protein [Phycisphaerales bacterium]
MLGSIAVWMALIISLGDLAASHWEAPIWRLLVPVICCVDGGWIRLDMDLSEGVDVVRQWLWPFPWDWQERWESFQIMWTTMDRPIFKGFYIAAFIALWVGFFQLPGISGE